MKLEIRGVSRNKQCKQR